MHENCAAELNQTLEELARDHTLPEEFDLADGHTRVDELRARLESFGGDVRAMTPEEMRTLVAEQLALWSRVARENNIRAE